MPPLRRSLGGELLFSFAFLTSAAVLLVGASAMLFAGHDAGAAVWALLVLWLGSTGVIVVFGAWLLRGRVLRPLRLLGEQADALAEGRSPEPPTFDTADFAHLSERLSWMADRLLDARSQVVRAEKLAAVGQLAAGVAHEIRNPLGALGNYLEVLRRRGADAAVVADMQREVVRMDRIVQELLDYARPRATPAPIDVGAAVRSTVELLGAQRTVEPGRLHLDVAADLPPVRVDRHAVEQLVVNLVLNARDARPDGRIWVGVGKATAGPIPGPRRAEDPAGEDRRGARERESRPWRADRPAGAPGIALHVADEGPGVPEGDRDRVFDLFYTTKAPGAGTGLGLAIAARTVHDAGGVIWVDRGREGGAVFRVFLPAAEVPA
ncbi:MAG TPA: HAMP domain-containing sensor histidine kinase [Gemmatimonadales bacterium]|nr:HAMP domain-containing sensor histidine kinase [Gemmatimonadales bacterium]